MSAEICYISSRSSRRKRKKKKVQPVPLKMSDGSAAAADVFLKQDVVKNRGPAGASCKRVGVTGVVPPSRRRSDLLIAAVT